MLALIAAFILLLVAFGVNVSNLNLFDLALALWAAHFAFQIAIPLGRGRGYSRRRP
jgi:hypothetical protein